MTELVIAVFEAASAANAAIQDLEVARIPSAVIQHETGSGPQLRDDSNTSDWRRSASAWQRPIVTVAVDDMHADAVSGILKQHGPLEIEERPAQSRRR
jgi:hypothetical protein